MGKRSNDNAQAKKDELDMDDGGGEVQYGFQKASAEQLKGRRMFRAKR